MNSVTFKELNLKESDIEEFLAENLQLLAGDEENLLIVGQQVRNAQNGRSDLIAIDEDGNLVLIEIKRYLEDIKGRKEPMEFQAIRYAANFALINDIDTLVNKIYAPYLEKRKESISDTEGKREIIQEGLTAIEQAQRNLNNFLNRNASGNFNKKQRIILVASDFDEQTLSACAWLSTNNVDISCFKITPIEYNKEYFLSITKILPTTSIEDYYVNIATSATSIQSSRKITGTKKRSLPKMKQLMDWGIINKENTIKIKNFDDSQATVVDENTVRFNDKEMSYNEWGKKVTGWSAMSVYEWIIVEDNSKTLHELRMEKLNELSSSSEK